MENQQEKNQIFFLNHQHRYPHIFSVPPVTVPTNRNVNVLHCFSIFLMIYTCVAQLGVRRGSLVRRVCLLYGRHGFDSRRALHPRLSWDLSPRSAQLRKILRVILYGTLNKKRKKINKYLTSHQFVQEIKCSQCQEEVWKKVIHGTRRQQQTLLRIREEEDQEQACH